MTNNCSGHSLFLHFINSLHQGGKRSCLCSLKIWRSNISFCSGARCQLCCWLSLWEAVSMFPALRRPNSPSQGLAAVRCQQNNHKLAVVRNDTRAAIDQQPWIIGWTERDGQCVSGRKASRGSQLSADRLLMWLDWAVVSPRFSLKPKMRSGKCRQNVSSGCV